MLRATLLECDAAAWKWMAQDGSCEEEVRVWGAEHICLRHRGPQVETGTAGQKGSSSQGERSVARRKHGDVCS